MFINGVQSAIPVSEEDSPYYGEYLEVKKLVEEFAKNKLPTYVLDTIVDESETPAIVRFELRPSVKERHRNATLWLNLYATDTTGDGRVRQGQMEHLGDSRIQEISARPTAYNRFVLGLYEELMYRLSKILQGGCPDVRSMWEVFLTAQFALPKPETHSRLIAVLGLIS